VLFEELSFFVCCDMCIHIYMRIFVVMGVCKPLNVYVEFVLFMRRMYVWEFMEFCLFVRMFVCFVCEGFVCL